mgnify:CR=1 FL=1
MPPGRPTTSKACVIHAGYYVGLVGRPSHRATGARRKPAYYRSQAAIARPSLTRHEDDRQSTASPSGVPRGCETAFAPRNSHSEAALVLLAPSLFVARMTGSIQ